jgi:hypothetical protein
MSRMPRLCLNVYAEEEAKDIYQQFQGLDHTEEKSPEQQIVASSLGRIKPPGLDVKHIQLEVMTTV